MASDDLSRESADRAVRVDESHPANVIAQITEALRGLKFGQVTITVQDGVVVQIERLERTRMKRHVE
ncbi:MAG: YezD family protein [Planctomycetaceae bacterium]